MQVALKSIHDFAAASIIRLATETSWLQIAGIKSFNSNALHECMSVNNPTVDDIVSKVIEKLLMDKEDTDGGQLESASANFVDSQFKVVTHH